MENDQELFFPIIIIGAGISGIAANCQLKEKLGYDQFRILDRQAEPGVRLRKSPGNQVNN